MAAAIFRYAAEKREVLSEKRRSRKKTVSPALKTAPTAPPRPTLQNPSNSPFYVKTKHRLCRDKSARHQKNKNGETNRRRNTPSHRATKHVKQLFSRKNQA
ncbi:MAG: hypothetical protein ACOX8R_03355 [Bacillota bacterium]